MTDTFFSPDYAQARKRFVQSANRSDLEIRSYEHPLTGPGDVSLFTDVVRIGPADASNVLILESGLHGAEGFSGSAIQLSVLEVPPALPKNTSLVLVHAINPWGFAWNRRFNEDNIDLNRHFIDWDNPVGLSNPGYDDIADFIIPTAPTPEAMEQSDARLRAYAAEKGEIALRSAVKLGQYAHPDGLYYGGLAPSWSARTVQAIARDFLASASRAALVDVHTGLGPYAFGECLSGEAPDTEEGRRASAWYGHVAHTKSNSTDYAGSKASILDGYKRAAPGPEWTAIGLEFGTREQPIVRDAVRLDGWLHLNGGIANPAWQQVKSAMTYAYNPQEKPWQDAVVTRGREVVLRGITGISS